MNTPSPEPTGPATKTCSKCGQVKAVSGFSKERAQCKECLREHNRMQSISYYRRNRTAIRERKIATHAVLTEKRCTKCGFTKEIEEFWIGRCWCKQCDNLYKKNWISIPAKEQTKQCKCCLETKCSDMFRKGQLKCKSCTSLDKKTKRVNNIDEFRLKDRQYYQNNKERINEKVKQGAFEKYWSNPDVARKKAREKYAENPEPILVSARAYRAQSRRSRAIIRSISMRSKIHAITQAISEIDGPLNPS